MLPLTPLGSRWLLEVSCSSSWLVLEAEGSFDGCTGLGGRPIVRSSAGRRMTGVRRSALRTLPIVCRLVPESVVSSRTFVLRQDDFARFVV